MSFAERAKAKVKQAAGEVLGNEQMKREGRAEERAATEGTEHSAEGSGQMATERAPEATESPVSDTVHNLVQTLSVKLDSAHRYGLYQEDALREGHEDCARVFADIAARERETIARLLRCLEERLGATVAPGAGAGAGIGTGEGLGHEQAPGVGAGERPLPPDPGGGVEPADPVAGFQGGRPPTVPGASGSDPLGPQPPPRS